MKFQKGHFPLTALPSGSRVWLPTRLNYVRHSWTQTEWRGAVRRHYCDAMDSLLGVIQSHGLKAIISPHNANDLAPISDRDVCDSYCQTYSANNFYTSPIAAKAYDARLNHILNYESKAFNGTPWKQLGDVIEGFDIQNEPFIPWSARDPNQGPAAGVSLVTSPAAKDWLCDRAQTIQHAVYGSGIQVLTGGIGGDDLPDASFSMLPGAISCLYINVIAMHEFKHAGDYGPVRASLFLSLGLAAFIKNSPW